jgi:hypothetical protein
MREGSEGYRSYRLHSGQLPRHHQATRLTRHAQRQRREGSPHHQSHAISRTRPAKRAVQTGPRPEEAPASRPEQRLHRKGNESTDLLLVGQRASLTGC